MYIVQLAFSESANEVTPSITRTDSLDVPLHVTVDYSRKARGHELALLWELMPLLPEGHQLNLFP